MLVALGFLGATLLALLISPAFWARAVRLTTQRIKDAMPLTELEIRADKDRLRAEYAIKVHRLESQMEQVRLAGARQQIELNRRDARINEVEAELERLAAVHEEAQNARRVLEQTVADRLPRVEQRLGDAKQLIHTRDQEIGELTRTADKQTNALAEARAINAQQQAEIDRLRQALATRAARNQDGLADPRLDGEVALRAEIESLRTKTREQAQMLQRLQGMVGRPGIPAPTPVAIQGTATGAEVVAADGLAARERADLDRQIRALKARTEDQSGEIVRLKAALAVFESEADSDARGVSLKESRIGLKARVRSLEAQNTQLGETVQRLRSELASANERAARQAAHFTSELKRLGAGTLPAAGQTRSTAEPQRLTLAERVAQARSTTGPAASARTAGNGAEKEPAVSDAPQVAPSEPSATPPDQRPSVPPAGRAVAVVRPIDGGLATLAPSAVPPAVPFSDAGAHAGKPAEAAEEPAAGPAELPKPATAKPSGRPRLLDRIAGVGRSS
jgi:hypothetical protein